MITSTSKDFISILSETKPSLILFYDEETKADAKKIKTIVEKIEKKLPLLPSYEFITDDSDENHVLAEHLEISQKPILVFFKDGCFNRYKSKGFTEKSIETFIGGKKIYA